MVKSVCVVATAVVLAGLSGEGAHGETVVFNPPKELSIHPVRPGGALYGAAAGTASWHVGQWNNPSGNIPDFVNSKAANESLLVSNEGSGEAIDIAQTGRWLECGPPNKPTEFDGLIGANAKSIYPGVPSAGGIDLEKTSLAGFTSLTESITVKAVSAELTPGVQQCPTSKAVALAALVFTDVSQKSTLFFQIILGAFNTNPHNVWWARGTNNRRFGYNYVPDRILSLGSGGEKTLDRDVFPLLSLLIENNSVGMDNDLSHWRLSGAYFGNAIYGQVDIKTEWQGYRLVGELR